ncbi:MAG TPA: pirin family protein [Burkholderiales bacterium]|nr:pirin family protein [Burkholderiales bacterium]
MLMLRKSGERGHANHGWLDTYHSFSFADYYDPRYLGYRSLRVINEDRVQPGRGFGMHGHRDMEIITYILDGALQHKDSMGNGSMIRPGDVQRMSAGRGVMHSEFNASRDEMVHLLQIWIEPGVKGIEPGYEQKHFDTAAKRGRLQLIASGDGRDGSVLIHQNATVYAALLDGGERVSYPLAAERGAYVHIARGKLTVNGQALTAGDAIQIEAVGEIVFEKGEAAEVLLFDLN